MKSIRPIPLVTKVNFWICSKPLRFVFFVLSIIVCYMFYQCTTPTAPGTTCDATNGNKSTMFETVTVNTLLHLCWQVATRVILSFYVGYYLGHCMIFGPIYCAIVVHMTQLNKRSKCLRIRVVLTHIITCMQDNINECYELVMDISCDNHNKRKRDRNETTYPDSTSNARDSSLKKTRIDQQSRLVHL